MLFTLLNTLSTKITGIDINIWGPFLVDKALHYSPIIAEKTIQGIHFTAPFYGYLFYGSLATTGGLKLAEFAYNYKYIWNKAIEATPGVSHMMWVGKKLSAIRSVEVASEITYYPLFNNVMAYTGFYQLFYKEVIREVEKIREVTKFEEIERPIPQIQTVYKTPNVVFSTLLSNLESEARQVRIALGKKETAYIDIKQEALTLTSFFNSKESFREDFYINLDLEPENSEDISNLVLRHFDTAPSLFAERTTPGTLLRMINNPGLYLYGSASMPMMQTSLYIKFKGVKDTLQIDLSKFKSKFPLIAEILTLSLEKKRGRNYHQETTITLNVEYDKIKQSFGLFRTVVNPERWSLTYNNNVEDTATFFTISEEIRSTQVEIAETNLEKCIQLVKGFILQEGRTPLDSYISRLPEGQQAQIKSLADLSLEKVREEYVKFKLENPGFRETITIETQTTAEDYTQLDFVNGRTIEPTITLRDQGVEETKDSEITDNMFQLVSSNPTAAFGLLVGAIVIPNFHNIEPLVTALLGLSNLPEYKEVYMVMSQMQVEDLRDTYNFTQETAERVRNLFDYIQNKPTIDVAQSPTTLLTKENLMYGGVILGVLVIGTTLWYCWPSGSNGIETVKDFEAVILKGLKT